MKTVYVSDDFTSWYKRYLFKEDGNWVTDSEELESTVLCRQWEYLHSEKEYYTLKQSIWVEDYDIKIGCKVKVISIAYNDLGWTSNALDPELMNKVVEITDIDKHGVSVKGGFYKIPFFALDKVEDSLDDIDLDHWFYNIGEYSEEESVKIWEQINSKLRGN